MNVNSKQTLCPYCFNLFDPWDVLWRCPNPSCAEPRFTLPRPTSWQFKMGLIKMPKNARHTCGYATTEHICPKCYSTLGFDVEEDDSRIIAIVGPRGVGKTHYIASMIHQLTPLGSAFGFCKAWMGDDTNRRYTDEYYNPLFEGKSILAATQVQQQQTDPPPLIYQLAFDRDVLGRSRRLNLVFFDIAGEIFDNQGEMNIRTRYLEHASAVILLSDPLQIRGVRDRLQGTGCGLPPEGTSPDDVLHRVVTQLSAYHNVRRNSKIPIPLALAFTKSDVLRDYDLLPVGNAVYAQPRHSGQFSGNVFRQIHGEMQTALETWTGGHTDINQRLQQNFSDYGYFCLSSLGESPDSAGKISTIAPFRVEDPLLWTLHKLGYIKMV